MIGGGAGGDRATKKPGDAAGLVAKYEGLNDAEAEKLMRFLHPDERRVRLFSMPPVGSCHYTIESLEQGQHYVVAFGKMPALSRFPLAMVSSSRGGYMHPSMPPLSDNRKPWSLFSIP